MVWLIGNKGMLGTELSLLFQERGVTFVGTDREVDITDQEALDSFVDSLQSADTPVDCIVNCAAYTAVDKAEDDRALCALLNVQGPANIAKTAQRIGASFIHLSTDYVFRGDGTRPYREDDPTDPAGFYGLTKRDGEEAALAGCVNTRIIRTAWLYGKHGNNFVHTMLRLMKERPLVKVVNDQRGSPTWARDLALVILSFIEKGNGVPAGIYHYSNRGDITWFDFAREIYAQGCARGLIPPGCSVEGCTSDEYPAKVKRPSYSLLDKTKVEATLGQSVPDWKDSLSSFLDSITQNGESK